MVGAVVENGRKDEALIARWAAGDEQAVDALLARTWASAYRVALALVGDPAGAEDVAQEAFVRALQRAHDFEPGGAFRPWFFGILRNVAHERRRADGRRRRREEAAARDEAVPAVTSAADEAALVRREVAALPPAQREVLALHYFEGLSFTQVAEVLGCPRGTVASRLNRGLASLRSALVPASVAGAVLLDALEAAAAVPAPSCPAGLELVTAARVGAAAAAPAAPPAARLVERARRSAGRPAWSAGWALVLAALLGLGLAWVLAPVGGASPAEIGAGAGARSPAGRVAAQPPQSAPDGAVQGEAAGTPTGGAAGTQAGGAAGTPAGGAAGTQAGGAGGTPAGEDEPRVAPAQRVEHSLDQRDPRVRGRVLDAATLEPLPGVELYATWSDPKAWTGGGLAAVSDAGGGFDFRTSAGFRQAALANRPATGVVLVARRAGYQAFVRRLSLEQLAGGVDVLLERGDGVALRGRVVRGGSPVAGHELSLRVPLKTRARGRLLGEVAAPREDVLEGVVDLRGASDAEGRFEFTGLPARAIELRAGGAGYAKTSRQVTLPLPEPDGLVIELARAAVLRVEVFGPSGQPEPAAFVRVHWPAEPGGSATYSGGRLGDPGRFCERKLSALPAGVYVVRVGAQRGAKLGAWSEGSAEQRARRGADGEQRVELAVGASRTVTFRLAPDDALASLACAVRDREGRPVSGVPVWVRPEGADWTDSARVFSRADGQATLRYLVPGRYEVQARGDHLAAPQAKVTLEPGGSTQVELTAPTRASRALQPLLGVVTDAAGAPVAGASVQVGQQALITDALGRFAAVPSVPGRMFAIVDAVGYRMEVFTIEHVGGEEPVRIQVTAVPVLTVEVSAGELPVDAPVEGHLLDAGGGDLRGGYSEARVRAGVALLRFEVDSYDRPRSLVVRAGAHRPQRLEVPAGSARVELGELRLEPAFVLEGSVDDPSGFVARGGAARVEATAAELPGVTFPGALLPDGRFRLEGLPGGLLDVSIAVSDPDGEGGAARATFTVDPSRQPRLARVALEVHVPLVADALEFVVVPQESPCARAGVQEGDLLVGLDGAPFADEQDMEVRLWTAQALGDGVDLELLRAGEPLTVRLAAGELERLEASGVVTQGARRP